MKYHTVTLGCQMNTSDTERIATVIEKMGFEYTGREEEADLLGIVACSVRQKAIDKVYTRIQKWNKWKTNRNLITFITGCILPSDREKFLKLFDVIFLINELPDLPDIFRQYGMVTAYSSSVMQIDNEVKPDKLNHGFQILHSKNKITIAGKPLQMKEPERAISRFWNIAPHYASAFESYIPIQNGCDKFCTFCAVPYTRGREISRPAEDIVNELKGLVERGCKSITLLGQNVNSYGWDKQGKEISFPQLMEKIGKYGEDCGREFDIYFTSPHPRDMSIDLIQVISRYSCLAKQIHLPMQSGDNEVLKRMNRNHTINDYKRIVDNIRTILPEATLFTDIIVGFSGETEQQFMNTKKAMEEIHFNMAYIACYSPRPGAVSSRWNDDVPQAAKKQRLHSLSELLQQHSLAYNREMTGKTVRMLVAGFDRNKSFLTGYTKGRIIVRFKSADRELIGTYVNVEITSASDMSVEGRLIPAYSEIKAQG